MTGEVEAAGDVLTGAVIAKTIEGNTGAAHASTGSAGVCRNCNTPLTGAYCAACGQSAHIHRSLVSLGHDILHGAFHFEGKLWRTLPELFFRPGRLTRRYIDGERAKFVSPMALFLFTVFVMFAAFSFTSGTALSAGETADAVVGEWKSGNASALKTTENRMEALREELEAPYVTPERRAKIEKDLADLEDARTVMNALAKGDFARIAELEKEREAAAKGQSSETNVNTGWPAFDSRLEQGVRQAQENPNLLFYKLKTNSYKFSWMLIPLSLPFVWLLFFWRRDIRLYDHAIFVTYSISFMMLLVIALAVASAFGAGGVLWSVVLGVVPPIHMYKQLRGAYGLSRLGAYIRLFLLLNFALIVIAIFSVLLVMIGVLG